MESELLKKLEELSAKTNKDEKKALAFFTDTHPQDEPDPIKRVNAALENADEFDRFFLTIELFWLWCKRGPKDCLAKEIFGVLFEEHCQDPLIFTVTSDNRQLRVWYGIPEIIRPNQVSGKQGKCQLLEVFGHPKVVEMYLKELLAIKELPGIKLPNGVRLFINCSHF